MALPILCAFFMSKAYRDERDQGSLMFIVTKKDHKSLVYFAKYIGAILATWIWLFAYFAGTLFFILLKTLLVMGGNQKIVDVLGINPPIDQLGLYIEVGISMICISIAVIFFWASIFFLLSRVLGSRGVVMSSMMVPMSAIIFPMLGTLIVGFGSVGIGSLQKGIYDSYEMKDKNNYIGCSYRMNGASNSLSYYDQEGMVGWVANDYTQFSTWDYVNPPFGQPGKPGTSTGTNLQNINYESTQKFENDCLAGGSTTEAWQKQPQPSDNWTFSNNSRDYEVVRSTKVQSWGATPNTFMGARRFPGSYVTDPQWSYKTKNLQSIKNNNKAGWLSFLNPVYYTGVLLEQPLKLIPGINNDFIDLTKILSGTFGGKHNAKYTIDESTRKKHSSSSMPIKNLVDASIITGIKNALPSEWLVSSNNSNSGDGIWKFNSNSTWYNEKWPNLLDDSNVVYFKEIHIESSFVLDYEGVQYWMGPWMVSVSMISAGLLFSWLAVRLNSRHDISR